MEIIKLSSRLQAIANLVPLGAKVADIGTDHGYIPVWLAQTGVAKKLAAADINKGPLQHAKQTATEYGVFDMIHFELCSGLSFCSSSEYDTVIIAGMGGENIASILEAAPWTADGAHTLLLAPHTKAEELRRYLMDHGYEILREKLVYDRGTIYPIMEVTAGQMELTVGQLWGGAKLRNDPLGNQYIIEKIIRLFGAVAGLNRSERPTDLEKADGLRDILTALMEMREEWRHANCT